jgi:hypothetical protein
MLVMMARQQQWRFARTSQRCMAPSDHRTPANGTAETIAVTPTKRYM